MENMHTDIMVLKAKIVPFLIFSQREIVNNASDVIIARIEDVALFLLKGLVFAGIADLARPADKLSPSQSTALAATGEFKYSIHI